MYWESIVIHCIITAILSTLRHRSPRFVADKVWVLHCLHVITGIYNLSYSLGTDWLSTTILWYCITPFLCTRNYPLKGDIWHLERHILSPPLHLGICEFSLKERVEDEESFFQGVFAKRFSDVTCTSITHHLDTTNIPLTDWFQSTIIWLNSSFTRLSTIRLLLDIYLCEFLTHSTHLLWKKTDSHCVLFFLT